MGKEKDIRRKRKILLIFCTLPKTSQTLQKLHTIFFDNKKKHYIFAP